MVPRRWRTGGFTVVDELLPKKLSDHKPTEINAYRNKKLSYAAPYLQCLNWLICDREETKYSCGFLFLTLAFI